MSKLYMFQKSHFPDKAYSISYLVKRCTSLIMPPTSKKFGRHIGLGLSVRLSIRLCVALVLGQEPLEIGS